MDHLLAQFSTSNVLTDIQFACLFSMIPVYVGADTQLSDERLARVLQGSLVIW